MLGLTGLTSRIATDNPLVGAGAVRTHHGGNSRGMAVTNATRLALHHLAKILFSQSTEMLNPVFNRGLPPLVATTDPSHDKHCQGVDISMAAALSKIGYLSVHTFKAWRCTINLSSEFSPAQEDSRLMYLQFSRFDLRPLHRHHY
jgi:hypothetical protein